MTESADVIVVGAGIGSLTAGCLLARAGRSVRVFEQAEAVGGYATTFVRGNDPRYVFDFSLHGIGGLASDGLVRANLERCGVWDRVRDQLVMPPSQYRVRFPDYDLTVPQCDVPAYLDRLAGDFPEEREGLHRLDAEIQATYAQYRLLQTRFFADLVRNAPRYDRVIRYSRLTQRQLFDAYLRDDRLKAILAAQWTYFGAPASKLPAITFIAFWEEYMRGGAYYLQHAGQSLPLALADVIRDHGGCVETDARVARILVEGGRACGVALRDGRVIRSDVVISGACPQAVVGDLLDDAAAPKAYRDAITALRPSLSVVQLFLGLDCPVSRLGHHDYMLIVTPSYDGDAQFEDSLAVRLAGCPLTIVAHGNATPALAEPGQIIVSALCGHAPWAVLDDQGYEIFKRECRETLLAGLERVIPDIRRHIVVEEMSTPRTNVRYTSNAGGAIYGFEKDIAQSSRIRRMSATPVAGLYFSSAWTFPGGGYSGAVWGGHFCVYENGLLPIPEPPAPRAGPVRELVEALV